MNERKVKDFLHSYLEQDSRAIFLGLCIVQIALIFIQEDIIGFRADFFRLLNDIGENGMLYWLLRLKEIGGYLLVPFQIYLEIFFTGILLWFGTFAFGYKALFKSLVKISTHAYPALFISQILKIVWFGFIEKEYSQFDLDSFHNFSPAILWFPENRVDGFAEVLTTINPGYLMYLWLLSSLLAIILKREFSKAIRIVLSFVFGLGFIWSLFVMVVT